MPIIVEGHELASSEFYIEQMNHLLEMQGNGAKVAELAFPIMAFFSGKLIQEPKSEIFSGHIYIFLEDKKIQLYVERNPGVFLGWVSAAFYYFLEMAAFSQIARSIWQICWRIVDMLDSRATDDVTLDARCQMAAWASVYDKSLAVPALQHIKEMVLSSPRFEAYRSLFLSTAINKYQSDFSWHIKNALYLSRHLSPMNKLQAYINYYCNIETTNEVLNCIISATNWPELADYCSSKMGNLETVIWTMQNNNNYDDLLFLERCLKNDIRRADFQTSHAFLLPTVGETFVALKKSEKISFTLMNNGESYVRLMELCNKLNGIVISIRGEENLELPDDLQDFEDYGIPSRNGEFGELRNEVVNHYHLADNFYKELNLVSLVPSHNHPIQSALCSLNIVPPTISTSLQDPKEEIGQRYFVFFLSSATYTHDIEFNWIRSKFGENAEIYTDPNSKLLLSKIHDNRYSHVYISAHGQHDHWERVPDRIHFCDSSEVSIEELKAARPESSERRTLILNICDGAATRISFNINNAGLAAALASSDQTVVSHLWPVSPKYAAIFGMLMLDRLTHQSANDAALFVYRQLNQPNGCIAKSIESMGAYYSELAQMVKNTDFEIADFRNIGSLAIYG